MTTFWRDGHYRNGSWVEGHWVIRDDWDRFSSYIPLIQKSYKIEQTEFSSFTIPNSTCPICGERVFYYENSHGSKVWFDDLGPPWPIHGCFQDGYAQLPSKRNTEENKNEPLHLKNIDSVDPTYRVANPNQENAEFLLVSKTPCTIVKNITRAQNSYITAKIYDPINQHKAIFLISETSGISTRNHICFALANNTGSYDISYFDIEKMQHGMVKAASIKNRKDFIFLAKYKQKNSKNLEKIREFTKKVKSLQNHEKIALADWLYSNTVFESFYLALFSGLTDLEVSQLINNKLRTTHIPQSPISLGLIDHEAFSFLNENIECIHAVI